MSMTIDQMIAQAKAASANPAAVTGVTIDHPPVTEVVAQPAPQPAANPLASLTPEQLAAVMAMMGQQPATQQAVVTQAAPVVQTPAPMANQVMGMVAQQPAAQLPAHMSMNQPIDFDMDSFMSMGLSADHWVKFSEFGLTLAAHSTVLLPELEVEILLENNKGFFLCMAVKYGNPAVYNHTFDGITDKNGQPWANAVVLASQVDPNARPYRCVQLPMKLTKDVMHPMVPGQVLAHAGEVVGYSTATTAWSSWESLYRAAQQHGLVGQPIRVKVTNLVKQPKKTGQKPWGIPVFTLLGASGSTAETAA